MLKNQPQKSLEKNKPNRKNIMVKPPFRFMFIAKSQSGKTSLLIKLLLHFWIPAFNEVHIFCPTYQQDKVWSPIDQHVKSKKVKYYTEYNESLIETIYRKNARKVESGKHDYHVLIILDDCVGESGFKVTQESGLLNKLCSKGNHANVSLVWSIQKLTQCSTIMRSQVDGLITFYNPAKESNALFQEFGMGKLKSFLEMSHLSTSQPYHYLYINRQGPGAPDYYHNFKWINYSILDNKNKK